MENNKLSLVQRLSAAVFGRETSTATAVEFRAEALGLFRSANKEVYISSTNMVYKDQLPGNIGGTVQFSCGTELVVAEDPLAVEAHSDRIFGEDVEYWWVSSEKLQEQAAKAAQGLMSSALVGQQYAQNLVYKAIPANKDNIKFVETKPGANYRGKSTISHILDLNPTWDKTIPPVIYIEADMQNASLDHQLAYAEVIKTLSEIHANEESPFVFLASDKGFAIVHRALADLFTRFAESHVNATQYLKYMVNMSLGLERCYALVVKDLKYRKNGERKGEILDAGTDGSSYFAHDFIKKFGVKEDTAIQFRAISSETVDAFAKADFTEYCKAFKAAFSSDTVCNFINSFALPKVEITYGNLAAGRVKFFEHEAKSELVRAKAFIKEENLVKVGDFAGKTFDQDVIAYAKSKGWMTLDSKSIKTKTEHGLFIKGAGIPMRNLKRQIGLHLGKEFKGSEIIKAVTPSCNYKALGKKWMKANAVFENDKFVVVELMVSPISIKNSGSMRSTPHVIEAAGVALSSQITPYSLKKYCETYDKLRPQLEEAFGGKMPTETEIKDFVDADVMYVHFKYKGKQYIEPRTLAMYAHQQAINKWLAKEYKIHGLPGDAKLSKVSSRVREDALVTMSKQMVDQMIGGEKRKGIKFYVGVIANFVEFGSIVVPSKDSQHWLENGANAKQPIQSAANHQQIRIVQSKDERIKKILISAGFVSVEKGKKGKPSYKGLNLNVCFVNNQQAELFLYADDDGDDFVVYYIPKKNFTLMHLSNVLCGSVKDKKIAINEAELSQIKINGKDWAAPSKSKGWLMASSIPGMEFNFQGGTAIGLFVNMSSVFKALGAAIDVPKFLPQFGTADETTAAIVSKAIQLYCELEGQNELDDAKKTKLAAIFMAILLCMETKYFIDKDGVYFHLSEDEFLTRHASGELTDEDVLCQFNFVPEKSLESLMGDWQANIWNLKYSPAGESWGFVDLDFGSHGFKLSSYGRAYFGNGSKVVRVWDPCLLATVDEKTKELNFLVPQTGDIVSGVWVPSEEGEFTTPDMTKGGARDRFFKNLLFCPRVCWETLFHTTRDYVAQFQALWMPKMKLSDIVVSGKHNYISYYRSGFRYVSKDSLAGTTIEVKGVGLVLVPSPLIPCKDAKGAFIPYFQPTRAAKAGLAGFVNSKKSKVINNFCYQGEGDLTAALHEMWFMALWTKWEAWSGVRMLTGDGEFTTVGEQLHAREVNRPLPGADFKKMHSPEFTWAMINGSLNLGIEKFAANSTQLAVYRSLGAVGKQITPEMEYELVINCIKSFGLDLETPIPDQPEIFYNIDDVMEWLEKAKEGKTIFEGQIWLRAESEDDIDHKENIGSMRGAVIMNALARAELSFADWEKIFDATLPEKLFKRNNLKVNQAKGRFVEESKPAMWLRTFYYDFMELVALQAAECEMSLAIKGQDWEKMSPDQTQNAIVRITHMHEDIMGVEFKECRACSMQLRQSTKKIGREDLTKAHKAIGESTKNWLNFVSTAKGATLYMCNDRFGGKDVSNGQFFSVEDYQRFAWFFGQYRVQWDTVTIYNGSIQKEMVAYDKSLGWRYPNLDTDEMRVALLSSTGDKKTLEKIKASSRKDVPEFTKKSTYVAYVKPRQVTEFVEIGKGNNDVHCKPVFAEPVLLGSLSESETTDPKPPVSNDKKVKVKVSTPESKPEPKQPEVEASPGGGASVPEPTAPESNQMPALDEAPDFSVQASSEVNADDDLAAMDDFFSAEADRLEEEKTKATGKAPGQVIPEASTTSAVSEPKVIPACDGWFLLPAAAEKYPSAVPVDEFCGAELITLSNGTVTWTFIVNGAERQLPVVKEENANKA